MKVADLVNQVKEAEQTLSHLRDDMDLLDEETVGYGILQDHHTKIEGDLNSLLNADIEFVRTAIKKEMPFKAFQPSKEELVVQEPEPTEGWEV